MILPQSDWVVINRPRKRLFGISEKQETGVVSSRTFQQVLERHIEPFEDGQRTLKIIGPDASASAASRFQALKDILPIEEFEGVGRDGFLDIESVATAN